MNHFQQTGGTEAGVYDAGAERNPAQPAEGLQIVQECSERNMSSGVPVFPPNEFSPREVLGVRQ